MATNDMITNAAAKTAIPIHSKGVTSVIVVDLVSEPISAPTKNGVRVAESELSAPPACISWLPLFPPPPKILSIGFTTVFNIHTQNPQMNAPSK